MTVVYVSLFCIAYVLGAFQGYRQCRQREREINELRGVIVRRRLGRTAAVRDDAGPTAGISTADMSRPRYIDEEGHLLQP